jgi:hypothetical protein
MISLQGVRSCLCGIEKQILTISKDGFNLEHVKSKLQPPDGLEINQDIGSNS